MRSCLSLRFSSPNCVTEFPQAVEKKIPQPRYCEETNDRDCAEVFPAIELTSVDVDYFRPPQRHVHQKTFRSSVGSHVLGAYTTTAPQAGSLSKYTAHSQRVDESAAIPGTLGRTVHPPVLRV